jgi:hypothetical protein
MKKPKGKPFDSSPGRLNAAPPNPQTDSRRALELYGKIAPLLAGQGSAIQGNAIAMMLGQWLHGHFALGGNGKPDIDKTREIRGNMMVLTTKAGFAYAADLDQQRSSKEAEDGPK